MTSKWEPSDFQKFVYEVVHDSCKHAAEPEAIVATVATKIHERIYQIAALYHNDKNDTISSAKHFLDIIDQYMKNLYGSTWQTKY